ncbi:hypothetical protein H5S09_08130 [Limosilactobacillus sp. STM2_1]|uniref:Dentin sialophosphoprotein n=1 Tax=Limosilactobacillus rudii TaxID=2759755 RepID=A0A7W3UMQ1_9LACO|nr:hypothetical protein [Limosilactobacillus rudii]MBB1079822.1 hypothetical protein [Limosilactobacillus rudii]MBB1097900.1 hypothetical protein [Limosilactobacillus rudii]MCD7134816.1 hypothetical protein [Limosilactobacillus rudii]
MKIKKIFTTIAAGSLMLTLAACGSNSSKESSQKSSDIASSKITKKHSEKSDKVTSKKQSSDNESSTEVNRTDTSSNKNGSTSQRGISDNSSSTNGTNYSVSSTSSSHNGTSAKSTVKQNSSALSQATMTATDARNIVKEHIGNQLNDRGVAGKSTDDLPSIDSVDGYTATQNGTNNWTVSGNGHTYHVTANSVTEN